MTSSRVATYGIACLILGWVAAGALEANHVSVPADAATLLILVLVVAAVADNVTRS